MRSYISRTIRLVALLALAASAASARADLIVLVQDSTYAAGTAGDTFDVLLKNTGASAVTISGFSFGLSSTSSAVQFTDVTTATSAANPYIFSGHSLFGPDITISSTPDFTILAGDNYDTPNAGISLAAGSTVGLGHVFFDLGSGASGAITVSLQPFSNTALNAPDGSNIPITTLTSGTITVSVPEPGSLVLCGVGLLGLVSYAYSRNRAKFQSSQSR
jgi:hypothetical protein